MLDSARMMTTSAEVIGLRTRRLSSAGLTPGVREWTEMARMGQEKLIASTESALAVLQQMTLLNGQMLALGFQQALSAAPLMWSLAGSVTPAQAFARQARVTRALWDGATSTNQRLINAAPGIAASAIKPVHTRASANARRLRPKVKRA